MSDNAIVVTSNTTNAIVVTENATTNVALIQATGPQGIAGPVSGVDITSTGGTINVTGTALSETNPSGTFNVDLPQSIAASSSPTFTDLTLSGTTASSSTTTGALTIAGGVGVGGAVYAGSIQDTPIGSSTKSTGAFTTLTASGVTTLTAGTSSTSATTGTLVITGGLGVSGNIYTNSSIVAGGSISTVLSSSVSITVETQGTATSAELVALSNWSGTPGTGFSRLELLTDNSSGNSGWYIDSVGNSTANPQNLNFKLLTNGTQSSVAWLTPAGNFSAPALYDNNNRVVTGLTAGTGVTISGSAPTGITVAIGQSVATTATPTFNSINATSAANPQITFTCSGNSQEYAWGYNESNTGMGLYNTTASKWLMNSNDSTYTINFPQTIASTSKTTGAVTIAGGLGVSGNINAGGYIATAPSTGIALQVRGASDGSYAASIAGGASGSSQNGLFVSGGHTSSDTALVIYNAAQTYEIMQVNGDGSFGLGYNGTGFSISGNGSGNISIPTPASGSTLTLGYAATGYADLSLDGFEVYQYSNLPSNVLGSLGIAVGQASPTRGKLYIGDTTGWNFYISSRNTSGVDTDWVKFSELAGVTINAASSNAGLTVNGTSGYNGINLVSGALGLNGSAGTSGQVLTSAGAGTLPTWQTLTATSSTNISGGAAGEVPYQTGSGATSFVSAGTDGQVFMSNGTSAPTWETVPPAYPTVYSASISGSYAVNWSNGNTQVLTLTGNATLSFSNPYETGYEVPYSLYIIQGGSGSYTITWSGTVHWNQGTTPTLTTTVGQMDVFTLLSINGGSTYYAGQVMANVTP